MLSSLCHVAQSSNRIRLRISSNTLRAISISSLPPTYSTIPSSQLRAFWRARHPVEKMADVPKMKQLSDLPSSLVTDILLRLPLETLLSCRYVCKAWDAFFADPYFAETQLAASPIHFLERRVEEGRAIHFGRVVKDEGELQAQTVDFSPRLLHLPDPSYRCVNSCRGLLCLVGSLGSISVCNPLLGQSVSIPVPARNYLGHKSVAIGFSAKDKLYKVLLGYRLKEHNRYGFEVCTLGTREWRAIDTDVDCRPWHHGGMDFNTFLHGSLHWISVGPSAYGSRVRSLQSFNFENEKCERLALPYGGKNENLDVQEYGVKKSWTKILAFRGFIHPSEVFYSKGFLKYGFNAYNPGPPPLTHPVLLYSFSHKHIVMTDSKDPEKRHSVHVEKVLIADDYGELICYNTKTRSERLVEFDTSSSHTYDFCHVTGYIPSFVSLQDVAKGETVKVSRITYEAAQ